MRRLMALAVAVLILASCGGNATVTDPYQILDKSASASYDVVQVNVGLTATGGGQNVTIDPKAIQLIADHKNGKVEFKVSLPLAALGADAAALAQLGVTGDTLDLDVVWDGQALYANGPVLSAALTMLMTQAGLTPGNLSGWLRLGTKAEFEALAGQLGQIGGSMASIKPEQSHDAASIKKAAEDAGVTVTYVGAETKNGKASSHLAIAVDLAKLQASDAFKNLPSSQAQQVETAMQQATVSADVWIDSSSYRMVEIDVHLASKDGSSGKADVAIQLSQPSDTSGLNPPATYTPVPMSQLLTQLLQTFGQGLISQ